MVRNNKWDFALHITPDKMEQFWNNRLKEEKRILLISGLGWDPRMTTFATALKGYGGTGARDIHLINYTPSPTFKSPHQVYIDKNIDIISTLSMPSSSIQKVEIITRNNEGMYIGDKQISKYYLDCDLSEYTDIIVDLSALPKSLYFTLLYILVKRSEKHFHNKKNILAVVCQNPDFDSQIIESVDDTRCLTGFKGSTGRLSNESIPKIWVPILARNNAECLREIKQETDPEDVYPILPFPSKNPRMDDDLLLEYSRIFSEEWFLNILNFLYAAEDDPIDVYQSVLKLYKRQEEALQPLGGGIFILSALSSKLSSLGAFMAAFEYDMAIAHAIGRHDPPDVMDKEFWNKDILNGYKNYLHTVWLSGEPYESES